MVVGIKFAELHILIGKGFYHADPGKAILNSGIDLGNFLLFFAKTALIFRL